MPKQIKKHYHFLDLSYTATEEDILYKQKALIKFYRAKGIKRGVAYTNKINKVVNSTNVVLNFVKKNGVQTNVEPLFDTQKSTIFSQVFAFVVLTILAVCCIIALI